MSNTKHLQSFGLNVTSQYGEDGLIAEIVSRIGVSAKCCIEFGAWDGKYLSNTWTLWNNHNWKALLIEGEKGRYDALVESLKAFPRAKALHAFVTAEGSNCLDALIRRAEIGQQIDLLSIDIDGDEYYVWKCLMDYRPRVVIVEHNPTIPPEIDIVQKPGEYFGASAGALTRLAHQKGYKLAACTETNSIFVANEDFPKLGISEPDVRQIFPRQNLSYLINSYDGKIFMSQNPVYSKRIPTASAAFLKEELIKEVLLKEGKPPVPVDGDHGLVPVRVIEDTPRPPKESVTSRIRTRVSTSIHRWFWGLRIVQAIVVRYAAYRKFRQPIEAWIAKGRPAPPPHEVKQLALRHYRRSFGLKTLVETGTYLGDMVEAMRRRFDKVYSIELGEELWARAVERFKDYPHIEILQGDSAVVLSQLVKRIDSPTLFWLDGHYSAGNTAKGELETPVFSELESVLSHKIKRHVILIDDARCFDGSNDYPTLESLKGFVLSKRPEAKVRVADDIIRITF